MSWLHWSLISLLLWGVWGVLAKYALQYLAWQQVFVIGAGTSFTIAVLIVAIARPPLAVPAGPLLLASLVAALGSFGAMTLYVALESGGKASVVIPLTAAYPVVTAVLSIVLLREDLDVTKLAAVALFVIATILVTR